MLTIGQVAELAGTTVRAVRHYHQTGLLPEPPRGPNGYRQYRGSDLSRLLQIRQLGELGLALADIRRLVDGTAGERRAALETLRDQYADQERRLAERRARITDLLAVDGDPAIPVAFRAYVNGLQMIGAPEDLLALDAEIFRSLWGRLPSDEQGAMEQFAAAMAGDPAVVATTAGYLRRLDGLAPLPPDHPDVEALSRDFAALLRDTWFNVTVAAGDDPGAKPELEWLVQDLISERLTPSQVRAIRGMMRLLEGSADTTDSSGTGASPAS